MTSPLIALDGSFEFSAELPAPGANPDATRA